MIEEVTAHGNTQISLNAIIMWWVKNGKPDRIVLSAKEFYLIQQGLESYVDPHFFHRDSQGEWFFLGGKFVCDPNDGTIFELDTRLGGGR